jgi:hypothetical protein
MPPKRKPKQKLRGITYKDTQNLSRSEQLPEPQTPIVIEIDHSRKRMSSNSSRTDSLVFVSDGASPSPNEPDVIQTVSDHASYSSFQESVKNLKQERLTLEEKLNNVLPTLRQQKLKLTTMPSLKTQLDNPISS